MKFKKILFFYGDMLYSQPNIIKANKDMLYKLGKKLSELGWKAVFLWLALFIGLIFFTSRYGGQISNSFSLPKSNSQQVTDIIKKDFPTTNNGTAQIVFYSQKGPLSETKVTTVIKNLVNIQSISSILNPYSSPENAGISKNGQIAYSTINYSLPLSKLSSQNVADLQKIINEYSSSDFQIEQGGSLIGTYGNNSKDNSELIGLAAAVIILLITFGSAVAMGIPIVSSLLGLGVGTMLTIILAKFVNIPSVGPAVATMIGIGVGIDYSLFILSRHLENLQNGMDINDSVGKSLSTSGKSVVVAGTTVIIANLGLLIVQIPLVSAMAFATAIAVGSAILTAITLLPASLGMLKHKVVGLKIPLHRKKITKNTKTFWWKWAYHITLHPWRYIIISLTILILLIMPVLKIKLGSPNPISTGPNTTQTKAYNLMTEGFGVGINSPLLVGIKLNSENQEQAMPVLEKLYENIKTRNNVVTATPPIFNKTGTSALISVTPGTDQNDPATASLIKELRNSTIPNTLNNTKITAYVGGVTAVFVDITNQISKKMIPFIGVVLVLTFLLLMMVFRSLFIPFKAVVMNLLSVLSAFGLIVMIFQWGWGKNLISLTEIGPIVSYVPMMIFAILFGLSMDYEIFILTRVKEQYNKSKDNNLAVIEGIAHTAKLITAAALVMISVFLAFVTSADPVIKMFGIGLAFAVFIDATLIRLVLVPATMDVAGKINWWLPKWLSKILPNINLE